MCVPPHSSPVSQIHSAWVGFIDGEPQPVNSCAVEETQFDGARGLCYVRSPPPAESGGRRDERVDRFQFGCNLDGVLNVRHVFLLAI